MPPVKIGISLGDPGGIGPEVTVKALFSSSQLPDAKYIIFGPESVVRNEIKKAGLKHNSASSNTSIHDLPLYSESFKTGCPSRENGEISFFCFQTAVQEAQKGSLDAVVTAPISKESWKLAQLEWAGHTEYLSRDYPEAIMSFFSKKLNVALFTHHISLKKAIKKIKKQALLEFFIKLDEFSRKANQKRFHLLIPGLNPHAGEQGIMGNEEVTEIAPAVNAAKEKGIPISGPFPPDTIYKRAYKDNTKMVAALYHDQGLIAFKIISFEEGVNVTLGLPFIRTSPDHGTAFDIAGKGTADPTSMREALKKAVQFSRNMDYEQS
ncbi:MAG: 4-hydroxythreonine-4-phosphate dehydrogenase PdxA [Candidatus Aminicenantes bacterium]|nr:4-hydroxythreonine-4-phosphate dehydrogenase PdxA [Candidatus Aminicenantes bacterium]